MLVIAFRLSRLETTRRLEKAETRQRMPQSACRQRSEFGGRRPTATRPRLSNPFIVDGHWGKLNSWASQPHFAIELASTITRGILGFGGGSPTAIARSKAW